MSNIVKKMFLNEKYILVLIFVVALFLRLNAVINSAKQYEISVCNDQKQYDMLAVNLLATKAYTFNPETRLPTSWRVPLYPLFLALIYLIFGHSYFAVRVIQCIISALLCIIVFYIAKTVFNRKIGLLSAIMLVFYQPYIFYSFYGGPAFLLSENLFTVLLALLVLFLVRNLFAEPNLKNNIISGILLGLLLLTRPIITLFPLFLFGLLLYKNKFSFTYTLKKMLPLLVAFLLVILPWTIRNYFVHKTFVPISTQGGFSLLGSNNPYMRGSGMIQVDDLLAQEDKANLSKMSEVEKDRLYRRYAKDFLIKNYKILPKLFLKKLLVLWDPFDTNYYLAGRRTYNIWYSIILIFGLFGITKTIQSRVNINTLLLISLFLYISIITLIFCGEPRLRYPIEPYLIIFASAGIIEIYNSFQNKFLSYIIIGIIIGLNFLLYVYSDSILNWTRWITRI